MPNSLSACLFQDISVQNLGESQQTALPRRLQESNHTSAFCCSPTREPFTSLVCLLLAVSTTAFIVSAGAKVQSWSSEEGWKAEGVLTGGSGSSPPVRQETTFVQRLRLPNPHSTKVATKTLSQALRFPSYGLNCVLSRFLRWCLEPQHVQMNGTFFRDGI